jgi:hypothetical protein
VGINFTKHWKNFLCVINLVNPKNPKNPTGLNNIHGRIVAAFYSKTFSGSEGLYQGAYSWKIWDQGYETSLLAKLHGLCNAMADERRDSVLGA